jgi:hypothetical protein
MHMEDSDYAAKLIKSGTDWIVWGRFGNDQKPAAVMAFELENGHVMSWDGWLSPAAYDRTMEALHALGFTGDDLDAFNGQEPHGRCRVTVKTEEYKGVRRQKIAFVNAATRFVKPEDRLTVADLKKLSAEMKKSNSGFGDTSDDKLGF